MELDQAQNIVKTLAQGVDPTTGELFAPESPYNEPSVIRALFTVHGFVRQAKKPKLTIEERRRRNVERGLPANAGLPWTDEARTEVASGFGEGKTIEEMAATFERTWSAIQAELIRQGLVSPEFR